MTHLADKQGILLIDSDMDNPFVLTYIWAWFPRIWGKSEGREGHNVYMYMFVCAFVRMCVCMCVYVHSCVRVYNNYNINRRQRARMYKCV